MPDFGGFSEKDFVNRGYDAMMKEQGIVPGKLAGPPQYANGPSVASEQQPTLTHRLNVLEKQFYEFQQHIAQRVERLEQTVDMLCRYVGK